MNITGAELAVRKTPNPAAGNSRAILWVVREQMAVSGEIQALRQEYRELK